MKKLSTLKKWLTENNYKFEAINVSKIDKLSKYAVSKNEVNRLKEWFDDDYSQLSFDSLFNGKLRVSFPFQTDAQKKLVKIFSHLKARGWAPDGGIKFDTVIRKQKMHELDTNEEYEIDVEVPILKLKRTETITIPQGPKKGQKAHRTVVKSIYKVLSNKREKAKSWMAGWWKLHYMDYSRDFNWAQIEAILKGEDLSTDYSVIVSRDPLDVLRMSDHRRITSCHSEGESYFHCAISESRGNGLVAYLVKTDDLNQMLKRKDPWGWDPETGKGPEPMSIGELDDKEIFADSDRDIRGIIPETRVRLRKYVNERDDYEFAAPEHRTYGAHTPGFVDAVTNWAWENQKELFTIDEDNIIPPDSYHLKMYGGSYRDSNDGQVLNSFFRVGGIEAGYSGNLETVSDDEESTLEMWQNEIDEILEHAHSSLEHSSFSADIDDYGDGPFVSARGDVSYQIPLSGWIEPYSEDGYIKTDANFKDIPLNLWNSAHREFKEYLEHDEHSDQYEINYSDGDDFFELYLTFSCDDCFNPDDVDTFFDWFLRDVDGKYTEHIEKVRRRLVENGYISEIEFDRSLDRLESAEFKNFDILGDYDDGDGEIWINSKYDSMPINYEFSKDLFSKLFALNNGLTSVINAKKTGPSGYTLHDEKNIVIKTMNDIARKAFQEAQKQLSFEFAEEQGPIDYTKIIESLSVKVSIIERDHSYLLVDAGITVKILVTDSDEYILFVEKFAKELDKHAKLIGTQIKNSILGKLESHEQIIWAEKEKFYNGESAFPKIQILKNSNEPDVVRLATWFERNWNNFSNEEKEVAYVHYLVPIADTGEYVHKDDLDAPRYWESRVSQRLQDYGYKWGGGISMKDVMPYTDPSAPIGQGLPPETT